MKIMKKSWWILGIGIVFLMFLIWPKDKKEEIYEEIPVPIIRQDLEMPVELPRAASVNWLIRENIELPKIIKLSIKKQNINIERENKIKKLLGINEENGFVDGVNNIIEYVKEVTPRDKLNTSEEWNLTEIKNNFKNMVEEINEIRGIEIEWTGVDYKKLLYPRWIEAKESEAQSVEIRGDYVINGIRITTYYGEGIKGVFDRKGNLLKLSLSLRPNFIPQEEDEELVNIDEASQSPIQMYGVFNNQGIEKISEVNITEAEIVEVYDNKRNFLRPYYWLEGNTYSENKPVKIKLLLKAVK
jgi:hypothetical protein